MLFVSINFSLEKDSVVFSAFLIVIAHSLILY